jgi:hypothetical protein
MGKPLDAALAPPADELDPAALMALQTDRLVRAQAARFTLGISPPAAAMSNERPGP